MIKEFKCYSAVCDSCKTDIHKDHDVSGYDDLDYIYEVMKEADWKEIDNKHYCDDCWYYDDEDNIVLTNPL